MFLKIPWLYCGELWCRFRCMTYAALIQHQREAHGAHDPHSHYKCR